MTSTRVTRHIDAPRHAVYQALTDADAVSQWRVPLGMSCEVHEFDPREGGVVRISLTYNDADQAGKTTEHTDTYRGRFVRLVPDELVIEVDEFESTDPALQGEMTTTISLQDADGGTNLVAVHDGLPPGVPVEDNEVGWHEALTRLAALLKRR
jgi:uncharacterized protein YndB with AHSA1/START domain